MFKTKTLSILFSFILFTGCFYIPVEETTIYSSGLVPEIDKSTGSNNRNKLHIKNISGTTITGIKLVYGEATFDEAVSTAEPSWNKYSYKNTSSIGNNDFVYCDLDVSESLKTLWVRVEAGEDKHCVFAVVYESGYFIDVNIRSSNK